MFDYNHYNVLTKNERSARVKTKSIKKKMFWGITTAFTILMAAIPMRPVNAQEVAVEINVDEDASQFDDVNAYLAEHGKEVLDNYKMRSSVTLGNINRLAQADSRWKNEVMQTAGSTIGNAGCCLTSFTIVRNCISGTSDTPATVNSKLGNAACPFNWETARSTYGYSILTKMRNDSGISNESARLTVVGAIDEYSRPVMIGMKYNDKTHFVVGYGYTSDGDIIICDPAGRNYTKLSQYYNAGYYVHRLYVYSK